MSRRDPFFDSLKFILICLVVFGHILEYNTAKDITSFRIYSFIYAFHMPLFIFISGYFSKNMTWNKLKKTFITLIPAYIIFQTILYIPYILNGSFNLFNYLTAPQGVLWYTLALIYWRIIFFFIARIKRLSMPIVLIFCFSASLGIGLINYPVFLAIVKAIAFLPYFALGYYCTDYIITKIRNGNKSLSCIALISIFILIFLFTTSDYVLILYGQFSYKYAFNSIRIGFLFRIVSIIIALVASYSVINIATDKLSKYGNKTLDIYLLHAPIVYILYPMFLNFLNITPNLLTAVIAFSVIMPLCILIMHIKIFQYLVNPSLLFEKKNK